MLLALCFPNWNQGWVVWVWQMPLLAVLWFHPAPGWKRRWLWGAAIGWVSGLAFFLWNLFWIRHVAWPGWILLASYLAIYFAVFGGLAATVGRLRREVLVPPEKPESDVAAGVRSEKLRGVMESAARQQLMTPSLHTIQVALFNGAAWVALEWLRGIVFTGFGWNGLGVALHESIYLIQIADVVGVTGLSFLVVFANVVAVSTVMRFRLELSSGRLRPHADFAAAMVLVILVFFYGVHSMRLHPVDDPVTLRAVLVQGNVSIDDRYDPGKKGEIKALYRDLTSLYADQGHDLIVWPETTVPDSFYERRTLDYLKEILAMGDFSLLIGNEQAYPAIDGELRVFNSMVLLREEVRNYQDYQKMHLVPFGEYVPLRQNLPLMNWILGRLIPEDFDRGTDPIRLQLRDPDLEIIPSICFEDTVGRLMRRFVQEEPRGAQVIFNLTNDAWFEQSEANWQHLVNAKFRAVELKRPMVRCANTGVTGVIDRFGSLDDPESSAPGERRILVDDVTGSPFITGCLPVRLTIDSQPSTTFYARFGDVFSKAMLGIVLIWLGLKVVARKMGLVP